MTDGVYHCKAWVEKESLHIAGLDLWKPVRQMRLKHAVAFHNLKEEILTLVYGLREWSSIIMEVWPQEQRKAGSKNMRLLPHIWGDQETETRQEAWWD